MRGPVIKDKPFNFMVGIRGKSFTVAALADAGVKRISLATSLYRAAITGLLNAAKEVREHGTFGYIDTSLATPEMNCVPARVDGCLF
jgi:2-methylisocitrate lyase-like PEP mutase family enzyme